MTGSALDLVTRPDLALTPDPRRVIVKLFIPGEDAALVRTRASALVSRITQLDDQEAARLLHETLQCFGHRHRELETTFQHHYELVQHRIPPRADLSPTGRLLVGAYFSHEYAVEAAALCNPSIVAHPDQSGLTSGQLRAVVSLRQIGEGHISSIGFATAVLGPGTQLGVADRYGPLTTGEHSRPHHRHELLAAGLAEEGWDNEVSATVLAALPEVFDDDEFERAIADVPSDLRIRPTAHDTLEQLRRVASADYAVTFPADVPLDQRVLWPATQPESNGMEDARFVRFVDDDGGSSYRATYTAYDGRKISPRMLSTTDFRHFVMTPMRGPAARNKGLALFPRPVGGRQLALSRSDGQTLGLCTLDALHRWQPTAVLRAPRQGWELIQVGNCGSPLETEAGWLVLTHGVGPMRRYAVGAMLLDLHQPDRVIAELPGALLTPDDADRNGYVPNVVYSCGGLLHAGALWLPYGISDARIGFAHVALDALLDTMVPTTPR